MRVKMNLVITALLLVLVLPMAMAAATVVTPASGGVVKSNYNINITVTKNETVNCSFLLGASDTDNTSVNVLLYNTTANVTYLNKTWNSATVQDSNLYSATVTCYNRSGGTETGSVSFVIDNTKPAATAYTAPSSNEQDPETSTAFTATLSSGTMTSCKLYIYKSGGLEGTYTGTVSDTHTTCSATRSSGYDDDYEYQLYFTDGLNESSMSKTTMDVYKHSVGGSGKTIIITTQAVQGSSNGIIGSLRLAISNFFGRIGSFFAALF